MYTFQIEQYAVLLQQTINVRREIINTRIQELSKMFEHISNKQASKIIKFYNPKTQQIIAQAKIPNFVKLNSKTLANLSNLSNRMKMLYIDVLHRGYYFNKPSPVNVSDIYKQQQYKDCQEIYISNNEAVYTIWRCLARQIGRPSQYSNISQNTISIPMIIKKIKHKNLLLSQKISKSLEQSSMISKQKKNALQKYLVYQKQLNSLQNRIISEYQRINNKKRYRIQQQIEYNERISKVLAQQILALELNVFIRSLVGIRKFKQNYDIIEIVLQQSYPTIKMRKNKAIELIGQATYNQLWQKYQIQYGPNNNVIPIVCHSCLAPLNNASNFQQCNNKYAIKNVPHTFLTDPYLYKDLILNESSQRQDSTKYIHPYLVYYNLNNKEQTPICNRYYCEKCIGQGFKIDDEGQCQYCVGTCMCIRCKDMDILTKMMAMYIQYEGKLGELTNKFAMTFDMKNLQIESKKQIQSTTIKHLRQQFQQYLQYFEEKDIFVKQNSINNMRVIKYFQQEATLEDKLNLQEYQSNKIRQEKQKIQHRIKTQQSKRKQKQIQQSRSQQRQEHKKKQKTNLLNNKKRQQKKQSQDNDEEYQESSSW